MRVATPSSARKVRQRAVAMNGAELVTYAMRQIDPDVVAAYPITPQTIITERFSEYVADGVVHTEFVSVESEHAALSACIGAATAGGRAQTASSGPGLALMWEVLWVASGSRLPIVLHLCTRALSSPINILGDHSDLMGARDTGWVILVAESPQEAYDNATQAVRIAEHPQVLLPVMSAQDGFTLTHSVERCQILPDAAVRGFLGEYCPAHSILDTDHPTTFGPLDAEDAYFEHKRQQVEAMEQASDVIAQTGREYGELSGRPYGLVEPYRMEDAEYALVAMGAVCGTLRSVVDNLRQEGVRAGMLKIRSFRPFPSSLIAEVLGSMRAIGVVDRAISFGAAGNPLYLDVVAALAQRGPTPPVVDYVAGLGGRDIRPGDLRQAFQELREVAAGRDRGPSTRYLGLHE
ncbi:MAG: pyruvate ferredoxin oxidoreductase [Dehalococcoidia bacterium]